MCLIFPTRRGHILRLIGTGIWMRDRMRADGNTQGIFASASQGFIAFRFPICVWASTLCADGLEPQLLLVSELLLRYASFLYSGR